MKSISGSLYRIVRPPKTRLSTSILFDAANIKNSVSMYLKKNRLDDDLVYRRPPNSDKRMILKLEENDDKADNILNGKVLI